MKEELMTEVMQQMPLGRSSSMLVIVISCPSRPIALASIAEVCVSACTGFTAPQPIASMTTASTAASGLRNALFECFILLPAFFFISWDSMASQDLMDIRCRKYILLLQLPLRPLAGYSGGYLYLTAAACVALIPVIPLYAPRIALFPCEPRS